MPQGWGELTCAQDMGRSIDHNLTSNNMGIGASVGPINLIESVHNNGFPRIMEPPGLISQAIVYCAPAIWLRQPFI